MEWAAWLWESLLMYLYRVIIPHLIRFLKLYFFLSPIIFNFYFYTLLRSFLHFDPKNQVTTCISIHLAGHKEKPAGCWYAVQTDYVDELKTEASDHINGGGEGCVQHSDGCGVALATTIQLLTDASTGAIITRALWLLCSHSAPRHCVYTCILREEMSTQTSML